MLARIEAAGQSGVNETNAVAGFSVGKQYVVIFILAHCKQIIEVLLRVWV